MFLKSRLSVFQEPPTVVDGILLCFFVILITLHPFFLHAEIIMMETGIHLPAINALFHGGVPYRDFYFLRGPLELYVPAMMIAMFEKNTALLPAFYYIGNVLTLLFLVLVARHLLKSRLLLYLLIPVCVARTFPRVSYYYWGGLRYALGFVALWCLILFYKRQRLSWIFWTGVVSCLSFLTTIEAGVCVVGAVLSSLAFSFIFKIQERRFIIKAGTYYLAGFAMVFIPYLFYLIVTGSLIPFIKSIYIILNFNHVAYPAEAGVRPETLIDFILAFNPNSRYFKFMTPVFCYLFFAGYLIQRFRKNQLDVMDAFLVGVTFYGLILYMAAFRKIEGHHFEMALQPEKLLLFFLLERVYFYFKYFKNKLASMPLRQSSQKEVFLKNFKIFIMDFLIWGLIGSSLGYAIARYDHRFPAFKLMKKKVFQQKVKGLSLLENQQTQVLNIKRIEGMVAPAWQAEEIEEVVAFLQNHTSPKEVVFTYPELGNFNFWADRPFVGRFPIATFTWMYEPWHQELVNDFKQIKPKYVVMTNLGHRTFPEEWYFRNPDNIRRFNLFTNLILNNYTLVKKLSSVSIYQLSSDIIE